MYTHPPAIKKYIGEMISLLRVAKMVGTLGAIHVERERERDRSALQNMR